MTQTQKERPCQDAPSNNSLTPTIAEFSSGDEWLRALYEMEETYERKVTVGDMDTARKYDDDLRRKRQRVEALESMDRMDREFNAMQIELLKEQDEMIAAGKVKPRKIGLTLNGIKPAATRELSSPQLPMDVAREIVDDYPGELTWWNGDFYRWTGTNWQMEDDTAVRSWIRRITERATYTTIDAKGDAKPTRWAPNIKKVQEVTAALGEGVLRREGDTDNVLALANGVLVDGLLMPHSPKRFNLNSLTFEFDPIAEPREWLAFLDSSLPNDTKAHEFLQEWFGYVLSGRTDKQVMASLIGKKRGGKGTIARMLEAMVGKHNATGITLEQLSSPFGMAGLIGKSLATISEPRWNSRQAGEAKEPLLRITGGDTVQVDRKYSQEWSGRLGVRFMILSNDAPRFTDRTGALASRLIHIRFSVSFEGREDYGLETRLMAELPGILNWALIGLKRLDANGRFTMPSTHNELQEKFTEHADPDSGFLDYLAGIPFLAEDKTRSATEAEVFGHYEAWCREAGRRNDSTTAMTLRHRLTERDGITAKREGKAKTWLVRGLPDPRPDEDKPGEAAPNGPDGYYQDA